MKDVAGCGMAPGARVDFQLIQDRLRQPTGEELARLHSIAHVALQRLADALLQPMTLLAAVVWLLNGSFEDVAIITVVASASYALGSVVMPFALARVEDIRLVLLGAASVRAAAAGIIAMIGWQASRFSPGGFVSLLVIAILFYQVSSAINVSRNPRSTIADEDQPTSPRARQVIGASAAIIGGLTAWQALGNDRLTFPTSAGWVIALGGIAALASLWFQVTAPIRRIDLLNKPPVAERLDVIRVLRSPNIRRYLWVRLLFGLATLADPFLIIFGLMYMNLDIEYVGAIMLTIVLSQVTGGVIWTFFREFRGTRLSIQMAALLRLFGIALALGVPFIADSDWYNERFDSPAAGSWAFVTVFFLLGIAQSTYIRNEQPYALRQMRDISLYPATTLLLNLTLVITAFAALVGAWIIRIWSIDALLVIAAALAFVSLMSTALLQGRRKLKRRFLEPELRGARKPVRRRPRRRRKRR
jgi:hypothetical protein